MKNIVLILIFLLPAVSYADRDIEFSKFIEQLSDDTRQSLQLELLEEYFNDPLNLVMANRSKLIDIGINKDQAESIINLIQSNDTIATVDQIFTYVNLSSEQKVILQFCTYIDRDIDIEQADFNLKFRSRQYQKLSPIRGFAEDIYQGSKHSSYNRLLMNYGDFGVGITGSRDIGEIHTFDSYNFFGEYKSDAVQVIAGDFYVKMGTGTILWNPFSFRKGFNTISPVEQYDNRANVFKSTAENSSFRGLYGSWMTEIFDMNFNLRAWRSGNRRSGTIDDDDIIRSIYRQGLYRYDTELGKQEALTEKTYGLGVELSGENYTLGYGMLDYEYSAPIESESKATFAGRSGKLHSFHLNYDLERYKIVSEYSEDAKSNNAFKLGTVYYLDELEAAVYYRYFEGGFRSQYGYMFGETSFPANEEGLYFALNYKLEDVKFISYLDIYESQEPPTHSLQPMNGFDLMGRIEYKPFRKHFSSLSVRYEDKSREYERYMLDIDGRISKYILRAEYKFDVAKFYDLLLRSDFTYTEHSHAENESWMYFLMQNRLKLLKKLDVRIKLSYFNTDSYYSAVWQNDYIISGKMYSTPMIGEGMKTLINLRYKLSKMFTLQGTLTNLIKFDDSSIGSGYDEIIGNEDLRAYLQLDVNIR